MAAKKPAPSARSAASPAGQSVTARVAKLNRWREQYNPLRGLTLARAVWLCEAAQRGDLADYQWACFFVEQTDPDLFALLEMRLGRILEMDYTFAPEKGADEALVAAQTLHLTEKFALIDNLAEAIEHLALTPFRGYAHCEKWFNEGGDLVHLEPVDQWNVSRDGLFGAFRYNPEAQPVSYAALGPAADMPPEQFVCMRVVRTINRIALFKFIRANLSEKDWDAFVEIFGFLGGVVIGPPNVDPAKAAEFAASAEAVAEGGSGFLPNGSQYLVNPTAKGAHPFKERLNHLSEKLVLVGTGGKLTMLTEAGSGTLAGGAHAAVFDQIAKGQAAKISECLQCQIVEAMIEAAFPGQKCVVYFKLAANAETNTGAAVKEVLDLSSAGFLCDPAEVTERTGWKVTIKPAAPAPSPFGGSPSPFANRRIMNRESIPGSAPAAVRAVLFKAEALRQISAAQALALKPLLTRLAAVSDLEDDAAFDTALAALKADLPEIAKQVLSKDATGELAKVWENILGTALVSGATTAANDRAAS